MHPVKPGGRAIDAPQFKYLRAMLTSQDEALRPDVTKKAVGGALEAMFDGLPDDLKKSIDSSPPVFCLRNGCIKEVHYRDEASFKAIDEALFPGPRAPEPESHERVCPTPEPIKPESRDDCLARRKRLEAEAHALYNYKAYPLIRSGRVPLPDGSGFVGLWIFQFPLKPVPTPCGPAGCFR